jgi:uncharacterized membrane protein YdjX (TVP38/TMEM64 family)
VGLDTLAELVSWMRGAGAAGVLVYALVYAAAAICLLPGSILMIGAGVAYGPIWGTLIASPASALAATAAFLVGRTVARRRVAAWAARDPRFAAIDAAVGDQGLKLVILVRLSPLVPFNVLNYALGLTRVRTRDYALGSLVGMLPVTFLYVYAGSVVGDLARAAQGGADHPWRPVLSALGLLATLVVTIHLTRLAKRALAGVAADRA